MIASGMFLLASCGGGNSSPDDSSSDTGALSFSVVYHSSADRRQPQAAVIDCAGEGVSTVSNVTGISIYPVQDHNIDQPVYFAGDADLHLLPHDPNDESVRNPCIDAGNGDVAPATDFDGNPSVDDPQTPTTGSGTPGYVDIGAFEYQP